MLAAEMRNPICECTQQAWRLRIHHSMETTRGLPIGIVIWEPPTSNQSGWQPVSLGEESWSHCWGQKFPCGLIKDTYERARSGFPPHGFPQHFLRPITLLTYGWTLQPNCLIFFHGIQASFQEKTLFSFFYKHDKIKYNKRKQKTTVSKLNKETQEGVPRAETHSFTHLGVPQK